MNYIFSENSTNRRHATVLLVGRNGFGTLFATIVTEVSNKNREQIKNKKTIKLCKKVILA